MDTPRTQTEVMDALLAALAAQNAKAPFGPLEGDAVTWAQRWGVTRHKAAAILTKALEAKLIRATRRSRDKGAIYIIPEGFCGKP